MLSLPAIAITMLLFTTLTLERSVATDGGYDKLYGFPLGWAPNAYYASMAHDVLVTECIIDFLVYYALVLAAVKLFGRRIKVGTGHSRVLCALGVTCILALTFWQCLIHFDGHLRWYNDIPAEVISRRIYLGWYP